MRRVVRRVRSDCLCECGGRTSWCPNRKKDAVGREFGSDCGPHVRERPRADNLGWNGIGTDDAGRAGRAVAWRRQFAQQIVMLERRRRKKEGVDRQPDERGTPASEIRGTTSRTRSGCRLRRFAAAAGQESWTHRTMIQPRGRKSYFGGFSTRLSIKNSIIRSVFTALWPRSGPTCRVKLLPSLSSA